MITRALDLRRSGSRRPRPSRFPAPGFPRGVVPRGRRVARRLPHAFFSPYSTRQVKTSSWGADLLAAVATVAGIIVWGGLFALLAA